MNETEHLPEENPLSTMPLTISRPKSAKLLGISITEMNKKTESGDVAVEWKGTRRDIPVGELARIGHITIEELAVRYAAFFPDAE
jgi:hypothetical protein